MSIQRWGNPIRECPYPREDGAYVTYADHVAAVAEAEQRSGEQSHGHYMDGFHAGCVATEKNYMKGYAAALDRVREVVAGLRAVTPNLVRRDDALAAIDALKGEAND